MGDKGRKLEPSLALSLLAYSWTINYFSYQRLPLASFRWPFLGFMASLVAQRLKCLPGMRETQVRSLGWEDPLEKENGNPLQYSCLENPMEGGAW